MKARVKFDMLAVCGLACAGFGIWQISHAWACIIVGIAVFVIAEVINAFPRRD